MPSSSMMRRRRSLRETVIKFYVVLLVGQRWVRPSLGPFRQVLVDEIY